jgi:hypothetical protein
LTDLVKIPDTGDLDLEQLFLLEDAIEDAVHFISDLIDERIRELAAEGWTQTRIAKEANRTQSAISKRMSRLGIEPASKRGRPKRIIPGNNSAPEAPEETTEAEAEEIPVEPSDEPAPTRPVRRTPADEEDEQQPTRASQRSRPGRPGRSSNSRPNIDDVAPLIPLGERLWKIRLDIEKHFEMMNDKHIKYILNGVDAIVKEANEIVKLIETRKEVKDDNDSQA